MKKTTKFTILPFLLLVLLLPGCDNKEKKELNTVTMYMWGGSNSINEYMDKWVAPKLREEEGIVLKRVPIDSPRDIINKLITEKQVGKKEGSADVIWMNGENFKIAKENEVLYGPFTDKLSNFQKYYDANSSDIKYDFGEETIGMEAPWGRVQFVYIYDSAKVKNPPKSFEELKEWAKQNPGKFAYPQGSDFTGSAFIRQALFETSGGYKKYLEPMDESSLEAASKPLWTYLNELKPYLWQEGKTYPESLSKLDQLYSSGEVWMTMGYDEARATSEIEKGNFPSSTKTMVFTTGTLANTHFLAIPLNSPNKDASETVINFLLSSKAQIAKFDATTWGDGLALDLSKLSEEDKSAVKAVDRGETTLSVSELEEHRVPEIKADYVNYLEKGWKEYVSKK